jgi:hypothetical protein
MSSEFGARLAALRAKVDAGTDTVEFEREIDRLIRDIRAEGERTFVEGIETMASAMGDAVAFDAALKAVAEFGARTRGGTETAAHLRAWAGRVE